MRTQLFITACVLLGACGAPFDGLGDGCDLACNGLGAGDGDGGMVLVDTAAFGPTLATENCSTTVTASTDGTALPRVGGVYDVYTQLESLLPASSGAAIFPGTCADLGFAGFTDPPSSFTAPTGIGSVAAALAGTTASTSLYGVVTAVNWSNSGSTGPWPGIMYVQDPVAAGQSPAPGSGVEIFVSLGALDGNATPHVGDVVSITGLKWSAADGGVGGWVWGGNGFEATPSSVITVLGTSPPPTPVVLTPPEVGTTSVASPQYAGMRVVVAGPLAVAGSATSKDCPSSLAWEVCD